MDSPEIEGSTDRVFGLIMAAFFVAVAALPLLSGRALRAWALAPAAMFLLAALLYPACLTRLNRAWMRVGHLLSLVVSPLAMGIVFFLVITPMSVALRIFRKKLIPLHFDQTLPSYWIPRTPPGPDPHSMRLPF